MILLNTTDYYSSPCPKIYGKFHDTLYFPFYDLYEMRKNMTIWCFQPEVKDEITQTVLDEL